MEQDPFEVFELAWPGEGLDMRKAKMIIALVVTIIVVILIGQNTQIMDTSFLFWKIRLSRSLTMLIVFFAGALTGTLLTIYRQRKKRKASKAGSPPESSDGAEAT